MENIGVLLRRLDSKTKRCKELEEEHQNYCHYIKRVAELEQQLKTHDAFIRNATLDEIESALTTCAFYDEMISSEGSCFGKRNGESDCDGCSYFEIDGNQLKSTIESLRSSTPKEQKP